MPWHDELWHAEQQVWQLEENEVEQTLIVGRRSPDLAGTGDERLLRYHWPLVWDSEVTYSFFYREGESLVHPAIGQMAFLLDQSRLRKHWISNGIWDHTDLDPLNSVPIPGSPTTLPLKPGAWNSMSLRLTGDTIQLQLNGVPIHREDLAPTNDRTFGLFYDSGQAEARVRNVVLQGNWPKTLLPVNEQELRGSQADEIDLAREALPAKFDFDFTKFTMSQLQDRFFVSRRQISTPGDLEIQSDGLHMSVTAAPGQYAALLIGAALQVEGDFDISSRYEKLALKMPDEGFCGVYQCHMFSMPTPRHYNMIRSAGQYKNHPFREVIQTEVYNADPARQGATYPAIVTDESPSGRMRVVRRGKTLTFLASTFDSDSYRVLYSEEVTDEALHNNDLHLRASCYSQAGPQVQVSVVWKDLQVRAEKISVLRLFIPAERPPAQLQFKPKAE